MGTLEDIEREHAEDARRYASESAEALDRIAGSVELTDRERLHLRLTRAEAAWQAVCRLGEAKSCPQARDALGEAADGIWADVLEALRALAPEAPR